MTITVASPMGSQCAVRMPAACWTPYRYKFTVDATKWFTRPFTMHRYLDTYVNLTSSLNCCPVNIFDGVTANDVDGVIWTVVRVSNAGIGVGRNWCGTLGSGRILGLASCTNHCFHSSKITTSVALSKRDANELEISNRKPFVYLATASKLIFSSNNCFSTSL